MLFSTAGEILQVGTNSDAWDESVSILALSSLTNICHYIFGDTDTTTYRPQNTANAGAGARVVQERIEVSGYSTRCVEKLWQSR